MKPRIPNKLNLLFVSDDKTKPRLIFKKLKNKMYRIIEYWVSRECWTGNETLYTVELCAFPVVDIFI